tara:strand:+ start:493 stop:1866 length:1374 start_codon:yes stop_codon:yes gene_type:complete
MATTITQHPLYDILPVGQDIIFGISNTSIVAHQVKVKFIAEVHISQLAPPSLSTSTDIVGTFKTTPNNAGIGMFDFSSIVESFVKSDHIAGQLSQYKGTIVSATIDPKIPLHIIDKGSLNTNIIRYLAIKFKVEYLNTTTNQIVVDSSTANSGSFKIFNGYIKHNDALDIINDNFGYDISRFNLSLGGTDKFLTNTPVTQYANMEDYGTMAWLDPNFNLDSIYFIFYDAAGIQIGAQTYYPSLLQLSDLRWQLIYFGCYPANLQGWSSTFQALVALGTVTHYTIRAYDNTAAPLTAEYTININCPNLKSYVPIRLAWLNQWGAWDYYTFTQKSVRSLSTKGSTYTQQSGTWNESIYSIKGYKGGEKSFRRNATERIKMNTNFVNESESEWFEELINSPEVYILEGFQTDSANPLLNNYVTPVRLTTSSYIRKTVANDRLMQYTFEIEKSKTLRTQAV